MPLHADPATFKSVDITASGPAGELAGTLLMPGDVEPPYNTVLILPGSGPTDRDGNNSGSVKASSYRLLAEALAEDGIASVRIDKRGLGESANAADGNDVSLERYADDVASWLGVVADTPQLTGDVWVIGHSEGGLIALTTTERKLDNLRALVLLTSAGRKVGIILREQLAANPANAPILEEAFAAIETLERGESVDPETLPPALRPLFHISVQQYLGELIRFDPSAALRRLGEGDSPLPVLIVHGGRDIQVSTADAQALAQSRPDAKFVTIGDMNHVLKSVPEDDRSANLAAYSNPDLPIVQQLVETLTEFIHDTRQSR